MMSDRITEDADWKEGMNAFRLNVIKSLAIINEELKEIKQQIKGDTP